MTRATLSVCMIVKNAGGLLPHLLANVEGIADEIVAVDDGSTDGTTERLERHPKVRVVQRPFTDFGDQKNFAFEQARGDWILSLDQDELLGDRLRADLPGLLRTRRYTHYKMPRYWLLSGPPWRYVHSDAHYPNWTPRLFRNTPFFRYDADQIVHHHFPRRGRGPCRRLRGRHLFHFHLVLHGRAEREERARFYNDLDPRAAETHRTVLFEQYDFHCRRCKEPLTAPGLVGTSELAHAPPVREAGPLTGDVASWACP